MIELGDDGADVTAVVRCCEWLDSDAEFSEASLWAGWPVRYSDSVWCEVPE